MAAGTSTASVRRVGAATSASRAAILDATEQLMRDEGYAAVSTRRVAAQAGLKPSLVHYYFPTTDDMLLALFRRGAELSVTRLEAALASDRPLHALWQYNLDQVQTAVAMEFMALASHRRALRTEIAEHGERLRAMQQALLARIAAHTAARPGAEAAPEGFALLLAGVARALVMEGGLGIAGGHDNARQFIENWIARLEPAS